MEGDFESGSTQLTEGESYERVVDGLRLSADGAKHLAYLLTDANWARVGWGLECIRKAIADRSHMGREADHIVSPEIPRQSDFTITKAFLRHMDGLRAAIGGLRQMGVYHRKQEHWIHWAGKLQDMQDKAGTLLKRTTASLH